MNIEKINTTEGQENFEPTKKEVVLPQINDEKIDTSFLDELNKKDEVEIKKIRERLGLSESLETWELLQEPNFDKNNFYRIINEAGYQDFVDTGIVRSSPTGTKPNVVEKIDIGSRPTPFPAFDKGAPDLTYLDNESENNYILETSVPLYRRGDPHPITGNPIRSGHWGYRPVDETGATSNALLKEQIKDVYRIDKEGQIFRKKS